MRVSPFGYLYFSVPSIQFSLFASFRIRPRHPWEALSFLLLSIFVSFVFFETLHSWFLFSQYLVAYDASLLGSKCYYNHFSQRNVPLIELVAFFIFIKEYFPTAASATITLLRLHFDQVDQLRSFHKHSFLRKLEEFITCLLLGSSENPLS